jgi:serine/threonine protein kinase
MMNHSMKNQCKVKPGTVIEGKWHHNRYVILKELGFGANGIVYLAKKGQDEVALKMSDNGMSITSEVNVLKSFAKVQGSALGPSLLDVDDWKCDKGIVSFYAMEYIKGPDLMSFIEKQGTSWMPILVLQLLKDLEKLHQNGWVFGDLKPENLIVTGPPSRIRCIDVGGTTITGRAVKEFTEFFDRGYWGLGSRKAEPSYDLFAVAMIMINTAYPKRFHKVKEGISQLQQLIGKSPPLQRFEKVILQALQGYYSSAQDMRSDLLEVLNRQSNQKSQRQVLKQTRQNHHRNSSAQKKQKKRRSLETILLILFVLVFYAFYIFGEII